MLSRYNLPVNTLYLLSIDCLAREDAYSRFNAFHYPPYTHLGRQEFAPHYYGSMQMMAPQFAPAAPVIQPSQSSDPAAPSTQDESGAPKKKNRWRLRYKAYNSCTTRIARQLHERCKRENVASDKSAQQCKNKMANLTKKYKNMKDKLRSTSYGRGGEDEPDKETENKELVPKHYQDMDDILGNREAVNPRHVLESSSAIDEDSSTDRDMLEKEGLDDEILSAASVQNRNISRHDDSPDEGTDRAESDEDELLAASEALFFKPNKSGKRKLTSTPKSRAGEKNEKKNNRKKAKGSSGTEESTVLSFLERAQERDETFMERMAEAERQSRREQQKFSMDALAMLGNILKDVAKGKE